MLRRTCSYIVVGVLAFMVMASSSAVAAEKIANPQYQNWAKFKVGSWVKYNSTISAEGQQMEMVLTMKLTELTEEKAVVETSMAMTVQGQSMAMPGQSQSIPAMIEKGNPEDPEVKTKATIDQGDESLTVDGKSLKCHWVQVKVEQQGTKGVVKTWMNDQIPGQMVKTEAKGDDGKSREGMMNLNLVSYEAK